MSVRLSAKVFGLIALVCAFQFALALGAPWGRFAMGGAYPDAYPYPMRLIALVQIALLAGAAFVIASACILSRRGGRRLRWANWAIAVLFLFGFVLNLISPSEGERLLWGPVAFGLALTAGRVAIGR